MHLSLFWEFQEKPRGSVLPKLLFYLLLFYNYFIFIVAIAYRISSNKLHWRLFNFEAL